MMEDREIPRPGEFYRHFKDKLYQIVTVATHTETEEKLVIYQALYGDFQIYARPVSMFLSEVDHKKYPEVKAKYHFEKLAMDSSAVKEKSNIHTWKSEEEKFSNKMNDRQDAESSIKPLSAFLDASDHQEKRNILIQYKEDLTEVMLDSMGISMDCVLNGKGKEEKFYELDKILQTKIQYEKKPR